MKIEILGGGCSRCDSLYSHTLEAVKRTSLEAEVIKNTSYEAILEHQITSTPALIVNGKVVSSGKVLGTEDIVKLLNPAIS